MRSQKTNIIVNDTPINASEKTLENKVGMSILLWATIITLPKPLSPVNHSPTTAPIIESGKDIRNAANKYGNAEGILKWIIISHSEAFKVLRKSNESIFTDLRPTNVLTITGKKVINATIKIFGPEPNPNQITNNGATAIIGVTLINKAIGNKVLSKIFQYLISIASDIAIADPTTNPQIASTSVTNPCLTKNQKSPNNLEKISLGGGSK